MDADWRFCLILMPIKNYTNRNWQRGTIRASAALMILRQGISSLASHRANRLGSNNKQFAPVTWKAQRELPGIRKTDGQPENECIHFLVCPAVFRCALCAQRASEAGCPEAVDCGFVSRCVSYFYGDKRRFSASLLTQKRSVFPSPSNFCLRMFSIRNQY